QCCQIAMIPKAHSADVLYALDISPVRGHQWLYKRGVDVDRGGSVLRAARNGRQRRRSAPILDRKERTMSDIWHPEYQPRDWTLIDYQEFRIDGCHVPFRGPGFDPRAAEP